MDQCLRGCLRSRDIQSLQKQEMSVAIEVGKVRGDCERLVGRLIPVAHIGSGFTWVGFGVDDFCAQHRSIIDNAKVCVALNERSPRVAAHRAKDDGVGILEIIQCS